MFSAFSEEIREHIGDTYDLIVANFSTTDAVERAASEVVLLDSMQPYFEYELDTLCGIPAITLEGTITDWESVASRTEEFSRFGLDWWIKSLRPVLKQFVDAAAGIVDQDFWDSIYKYHGSQGSGSPYVSGWVSTLFPYLQGWSRTFKRSQWIDTAPSHHGPSREAFPNAASKAPFKWIIGVPPNTTTYEMDFIGGLIGVAQCQETFTLRPEIGWAVRESSAIKAEDGEHPLRERRNLVSLL